MRVLVVEDNEVEQELLRNVLEHHGYDVTVAADGREALEAFRRQHFRMLVSDWEMPEVSGLELCREIRRRSRDYTYIVLLTSRSGPQNAVQALNAGVDDFVSKPFEPQELLMRLRAGERVLGLESRDLTIFSLAKLAESRDPETGAHLERMREYCRLLGDELLRRQEFPDILDADYVAMIYQTSPLHDIGKVGIPDSVLLKKGRLTSREFEIMKLHVKIGGETLEAAVRAHPEARFLQMARDIAISHHERYNGTGYPAGLVGDDIPLCGRIVAVADVYDALVTRRIYKPAFSHAKATGIILSGRGKHFDPRIVDAFQQIAGQFHQVRQRFSEPESDAVPPLLTTVPGGLLTAVANVPT